MLRNNLSSLTFSAVLVTVFLFTPYLMHAGVWLRPKGSGYSQISFTTKSYQNRYLGGYADTEKFGLRREVTQTSISFYGEYGLNDKLTLVANVPYMMLSTDNLINYDENNPYNDTLSAGSISGLGNITLSLKYPIKTDGLNISVQLTTEMATATYDNTTGLRTGYDAWAFIPSVLVGKGYSNRYFSLEAGPLIRTNGYNFGLIANGEYGWTPNNKTYLMGVVNGVFKLSDGNYDDMNSKHTATFIDNQGYVAIGAKIYQKLSDHFSVNATFYSGFAVINQGDNPGGLFVGAAYEW